MQESNTAAEHKCQCDAAKDACIEMTARMMVDMDDIISQINVALGAMLTENVVKLCSMFDLKREDVVAKSLQMKRDILNGTAFAVGDDSEGGIPD